MKLYINDQMVLPVLGRLTLRKTRSEAAATLTATLYTAAADTYFQKLSLAVGDVVRLLDDNGGEAFLGSVHVLSRSPEQVELTAYDRGVFLKRNELRGVYCGSPGQIARRVAEELGIPLGTVEVPEGWACVTAQAGSSAFAILRRAVGEGIEISIREGALCLTRAGWTVYELPPSRVLEVEGRADLTAMVNRAQVINGSGNVTAEAENSGEMAKYGQFQAVLTADGTDPARQAKDALRGCQLGGEVLVLGDLNYRCGCAVELHRPDWGLDGAYAVTGAAHLWEGGLYTTTMTLEWIRP